MGIRERISWMLARITKPGRWLLGMALWVHGPMLGAETRSNRGIGLQVHGHRLESEFGALTAREGHRFLVLEVQFANVVGAELVFEHDVPQRVELAGLRQKIFLHWNGRTVCRLAQERQGQPGHLPNEFILRRHGSKRAGTLVFEVPSEDMEPSTLHYFHDGFGPIEIPLGGEGPNLRDPEHRQSNQVLELAVSKVEQRAPSLPLN